MRKCNEENLVVYLCEQNLFVMVFLTPRYELQEHRTELLAVHSHSASFHCVFPRTTKISNKKATCTTDKPATDIDSANNLIPRLSPAFSSVCYSIQDSS